MQRDIPRPELGVEPAVVIPVTRRPAAASALPMATNIWVEPDVSDSMTGAMRRSEARASVTAMSFVMDESPFRRLVVTTMGAPFRLRGRSIGNSTAK